jgi:cationic amino acid transporter 4
MVSFAALMSRRKAIDTSPSNLPRRLTLLDLTLLSAGATLGGGAYVLGPVIAAKTGTSVLLSFLIAGVASMLSALCYAEFGARVPRAGSAYVYSYVTMGEVLAWTTGWQLLLEYIIGASSVARAWSGYVDTLTGGAISGYLSSHLPAIGVTGLAPYPDLLAFSMTLALTLVCALGAKESSTVNNVLTISNLLVLVFVVGTGLRFARAENLTASFAPAGFGGILGGASTSAFAYVGACAPG